MYRNYPGSPKFPKLTVTMGFIISWAIAFVLSWIPGIGKSWFEVFHLSLRNPWSFVTYQWTFAGGGDFVSLFFACFFLLSFAATIQNMTTRVGLALLFLGSGAAFGLLGLLLEGVYHHPIGLAGPYLTCSFIVILWCSTNRGQVINIYGILPIPSPWIAVLLAGSVLFSYGSSNPLLGLVLMAPLLVAWFFPYVLIGASADLLRRASQRKKKVEKDEAFDEYMTKVKAKETEREERERLRQLFENSFKDDEPKL